MRLKDSLTCKSEAVGTLRGWNKSTMTKILEFFPTVAQKNGSWKFGEFEEVKCLGNFMRWSDQMVLFQIIGLQ